MEQYDLGIVGGGQLHRLQALEIARHGIHARLVGIDPSLSCPAAKVGSHIIKGEFEDPEKVRQLVSCSKAIGFEIERCSYDVLNEAVAAGKPVNAAPETLQIIRDKGRQKEYFESHSIPVAPYTFVTRSIDDIAAGVTAFGGRAMLKSRLGAYDGKGNAQINSAADIPGALAAVKSPDLYLERFINFDYEISVIAARSIHGDVRLFPLARNVHKNSVLFETCMPAPVPEAVREKAEDLARATLGTLKGAGVFGIEMFVLNGEPIINEVASRVHNSGHATIELCNYSQFIMHHLAITGQRLPEIKLEHPAAVMINLLGADSDTNTPYTTEGLAHAQQFAAVHLYGKDTLGPRRKMGHLTATGGTMGSALTYARTAFERLRLVPQ